VPSLPQLQKPLPPFYIRGRRRRRFWGGRPNKYDIIHVLEGIASVCNGPRRKDPLISCALCALEDYSRELSFAERLEVERGTGEWSAWIPILLGEKVLPARGFVIHSEVRRDGKWARLHIIGLHPAIGILRIELCELFVSGRSELRSVPLTD
jgi:hypothetical protein